MVVQTITGPEEEAESLGRRPDEMTDHGAQTRRTWRYCERLRTKTPYKELVEKFHRKEIDKFKLQEEFKKYMKSGGNTEELRNMGVVFSGPGNEDTDIETFLNTTNAFENQMMYQIERDYNTRKLIEENMVEDCFQVASDEQVGFDTGKLRNELEKEPISRLKTFLDTPRYRKSYIKKYAGTDIDFSDLDFDTITRKINNLSATSHDAKENQRIQEIKDAWLRISNIAEPGESLSAAFNRLVRSGGKGGELLSGPFKTFFSDANTAIPKSSRERMLNFLTDNYVPLIPGEILQILDPTYYKKRFLSAEEEQRFNTITPPPGDQLLVDALKRERGEQWGQFQNRHFGMQSDFISTRNLPFETRVRILEQFGSIGLAEKMTEFYKGKTDTLRLSTDSERGYREKFLGLHKLHPSELETKQGLVDAMMANLGHHIEGIDNFKPGCIMQWKRKVRQGPVEKEVTGYYYIESVPGNSIYESNIISTRFLGDSTGPLAPGGLVQHYTPASFYHQLSSCDTYNETITFRSGDDFYDETKRNESSNKLPRFFSKKETSLELRKQFPDVVEIRDLEALNADLDNLLKDNRPKEAKEPEKRRLHEGMVFAKMNDSGTDMFEVESINEGDGTITLWDGWGEGDDNRKTLSYHDFFLTIKHLKEISRIHRVPTNGKALGIDQFNSLCGNESQFEEEEGLKKKMGALTLKDTGGGKSVLCQLNKSSGGQAEMPIIQVGNDQDIYIESIEGRKVTYRIGTFTQSEAPSEKKKGKAANFSGSDTRIMSLAMLWAYLHDHVNFRLEKPVEVKEKLEKEPESNMSWLNILLHSHKLGVILHGDLFTAPWKAFHEQHEKDHAFAGKLTSALAIEKLQKGEGALGTMLKWSEWPYLMVADGSSSVQSYLDELVNKIDGMASYHRTRLIKKWATTEHFPSPKFMAALFASMNNFGQLYPYDDDKENSYYLNGKKEQWFWYTSIVHNIDPGHNKYPSMPPKDGKEWPPQFLTGETNEKFRMNESEVLYKVFNEFKHPMLSNLGRRFQKYMMQGQTSLEKGATANLNQRTTMTDKLDWMMSTVLSNKLPEAFGEGTELWLGEGYPTDITTMPYAALLFGCREKQLLPPTREHIRVQFQDQGYHIPMFVFMQNEDLGEVFRDTGVAFAYTISASCGDELKTLVDQSRTQRLFGSEGRAWGKRFEKFWRSHGRNLMHKMSGMRDPMLNLMIRDPDLFDELLDGQSGEKRAEYATLKEKKPTIKAYYQRLYDTYGDTSSHAAMDRNKGYYSGDHFRFRDSFESGIPIGWINWDNYLDPNLVEEYASGAKATTGDGVFNEIRGFLYAIPKLSERMAAELGYEGDTSVINKIAKSLFEKNSEPMKRLMGDKITVTNPKAAYCSTTVMMLEIKKVEELVPEGVASERKQHLYKTYYEQMLQSLERARQIENDKGFAESLKYRSTMADRWKKIIQGSIDTRSCSIDNIYEGRYGGTSNGSEEVVEETHDRSNYILNRYNEFQRKTREGQADEGKQLASKRRTNDTDEYSPDQNLPLGA